METLGNGYQLDIGVVGDLNSTIATQLTLSYPDISFYELHGRLGQLNIFSEPGLQIQFPTPVSPVQAGVVLNFLHYTAPQWNDLIFSTAVQGATSYLDGQGWQLAPSLNGDLTHARLEWLSLTVSVPLNISFENGHGVVEPAASIGLTVHWVPAAQQFFRFW